MSSRCGCSRKTWPAIGAANRWKTSSIRRVATETTGSAAMTAHERRGSGRRSKTGRSGGGIPQLPWQHVTNPYAPMQLLNEEQIDQLHRTSMRILSELGIRVMGEKVLA